MFTGIIEATGHVESILRTGGDFRLKVNSGELDLSDVKLGDSIATNGVCLTVVEHDRRLVIQVEDDGPGISQSKIDSIFNRGTRADTYASGHGIGLAIVRDLIESYQGDITISQSKQLNGACFVVEFGEVVN